MVGKLRAITGLFLLIGLAACSSAAQQSSPAGLMQAPPAPPAPAGGISHSRVRPKEVIGGGTGGKNSLQVNIGDVGLPNGSGITAIDVGVDEVYVTSPNGTKTIVAQFSTPQVINVLAYQGGSSTPIAAGTVAQTTYSSLTLVVDTASSNYVGAAGYSHPLAFESNQSTRSSANFGASTSTGPGPTPGSVAITFNQAFQVAGSSVDVDVDYNVMESFMPNQGTGYSRPSLTVAQEGLEGSIAGSVANANGEAVTNAVVVATASNGATAATSFTDGNGNYLLHTLPSGAYQITVYNEYTSATGWSIAAQEQTQPNATVQGPSVTVTAGQTTSAGTIAD